MFLDRFLPPKQIVLQSTAECARDDLRAPVAGHPYEVPPRGTYRLLPCLSVLFLPADPHFQGFRRRFSSNLAVPSLSFPVGIGYDV